MIFDEIQRRVMLRIKRLYKTFILVILLFVAVSVLLQKLQSPRFLHHGGFVPSLGKPFFSKIELQTTVILKKYSDKISIWNTSSNYDRIVEQLDFKPEVDDRLKPKYIYVNGGLGGWGMKPGNNSFYELECNVKKCHFDEYASADKHFDVIVIKETDLGLSEYEYLIEKINRIPDQIWIMFALESPLATPSYEGINDKINWTATYRRDSTIVTPYERWRGYGNFTPDLKPRKNYAAGKTKMAAMFVSNCGASNNRLDYVRDLQQHISVDVYGACGNMTCFRDDSNTCFDMLKTQYKFYLAFENANCRHYITEKFFMNALRNDVLPVVMGAHPEDYKAAAPPGSYLHVEDFESPKDLALYLRKLDKDDNLYNQYFRWKETGSFINTKFWCRICAMAWDPKKPRLSVKNLDDWWRGKDICAVGKNWKDVGKSVL